MHDIVIISGNHILKFHKSEMGNLFNYITGIIITTLYFITSFTINN